MSGYISHGNLPGEGNLFRPDLELQEKRIGAKEHPLISGPEAVIPLISFVPASLAHEALRTGKIMALFCGGGNPLNMQNAKGVWEALTILTNLMRLWLKGRAPPLRSWCKVYKEALTPSPRSG